MPELNEPLIAEVLAYIDAHPERHDQAQWLGQAMGDMEVTLDSCKTTGCFAGWTVLVSGGKAVRKHIWGQWHVKGIPGIGPNSEIPGAARRLLGLTGKEARLLFYDTMFPWNFGVDTKRQAVTEALNQIRRQRAER